MLKTKTGTFSDPFKSNNNANLSYTSPYRDDVLLKTKQ